MAVPAAVAEPALRIIALLVVSVVEIASVKLMLPLLTEIFTAPVAEIPVGLTVPIVKLVTFLNVKLPIS